MMGYFTHLLLNWTVALKGIILVLFHLLHGLIPAKITSHEYWGFDLKSDVELPDTEEK